tara:strand:+ start:4768 stop:5094 length:327 start_codon:yes stop_codon:yes gene_type:complete
MNINSKHILLEGRKSINGLEVSDNLGHMNWHEAIVACKKLGAGWRLPTKDELNMIYKNREEVGGFANSDYWSSTEDVGNIAWIQAFNDGFQYLSIKYSNYYVRAVRAS